MLCGGKQHLCSRRIGIVRKLQMYLAPHALEAHRYATVDQQGASDIKIGFDHDL